MPVLQCTAVQAASGICRLIRLASFLGTHIDIKSGHRKTQNCIYIYIYNYRAQHISFVYAIPHSAFVSVHFRYQQTSGKGKKNLWSAQTLPVSEASLEPAPAMKGTCYSCPLITAGFIIRKQQMLSGPFRPLGFL